MEKIPDLHSFYPQLVVYEHACVGMCVKERQKKTKTEKG